MTTHVVVLGASGMLGAMVLDWLARDTELTLTATARSSELLTAIQTRQPGLRVQMLDAETCTPAELATLLRGAAWAINAIGVIKPYIHDDRAAEVERATRVNALFPHLLAPAAAQTGTRILQIATDCVYSGSRGAYVESSPSDALDAYGKTKSLGEVHSPQVHHLRCSIIGPETKGHVSLLDWFLGQPQGAGVNGYTNHQWNGVTTLHFARLCHGLIQHPVALPHLQHIVPTGAISKADLLGCFARDYHRSDLTITPGEARTVIDRTLSTEAADRNRQLWAAAGYSEPPTVPQMVAELAAYDSRLSGANP